jgi:hypothetical protein
MSWTLNDYCASQLQCLSGSSCDIHGLPESSRDFLTRLGLSTVHPLCGGGDDATTSSWMSRNMSSILVVPPPQGPLLASSVKQIHDFMWQEIVVTWFLKTVPPYIAFFELWLRLLAGYVTPVAILYLLWYRQQQQHNVSKTQQQKEEDKSRMANVLNLLAVAGSAIIMTDSM